MNKRTYITPGTKVGLKLTAAERKLILKDIICQDDNYLRVVRDTPANEPVQFTLDDWDSLNGYIAAEANHTEDKKLEKKLDAIYDKVQNILDTHTDEEPPKTVKILNARKAKVLSEQAVKITECVARVLMIAEQLGIKNNPLEHFWLAPAQEDVLLLVPGISKAIKGKLAKKESSFTLVEVAGMMTALAEDLLEGDSRKQVAVLLVVKHLMDRLQAAFGPPETNESTRNSPKVKTSAATVFQFKITLKGIEPPIWRRIQVKDCTLDKLHEHIQTAMGWTNSHLHQFEIGGVRYGDPQLLTDEFDDETPPINSLRTKVSKIIPKDGKRFSFAYEYDFGDGWEHEILFEGFLTAEKGTRYPLCLEGERTCPPEDIGGSYGYEEYLEALADPKHKQHKEFVEWNGPFDPEKFDVEAKSKEMRKGLPDWRNEEYE